MIERAPSNIEAAVNTLGEVKSLEVGDKEEDVFGTRVASAPAVKTITQSSEAKPVTIRQVAPLVLVLTGATFLMVMASFFALGKQRLI